LLDVEASRDLAAVFKALSDPVRLRLLGYVAASQDGTACACHLPEALGITQPTLSHHLKALVSAGLLSREQRGKWAHYTVTSATLDLVRAHLTTLG
jgi:ArsR family transcriptional regulator, arsenate/arsenite/antimonite-responsive transcriptional repressor